MKTSLITRSWLLLPLLLVLSIGCDTISPPAQIGRTENGNSNANLSDEMHFELTEGLVAHWTFNDLAGSIVEDVSGNSYDGTNDGALLTTGPIGGALLFDGYDDRVLVPAEDVPPPVEIGNLTQGSLCMWFTYSEFSSDTTEVAPLIYFGRDEGPYSGLIVEIGHGSSAPNRKLYFTIIDNTDSTEDQLAQCYDSNFDLEPDRWYHYCAVVSDSGNTGYLDGLEMIDRRYNLNSDSSFTEFFASVSVQEMLVMGQGKYAKRKSMYYYPGSIDDVRIYDRPLSSDEAWALYQLGDVNANQPPIADFSVTQQEDLLTFDVDATTSTDDGTIVQYDWDFGDGQSGSGLSLTHTYADPGIYTITLTVTDDGGLTDDHAIQVTAGNQPPAALFTYEAADLVVTFADQSTDNDGQVVSWQWDFGDGQSADAQHPTYTYATPGTYTVTLTVTDDGGADGTYTDDITVTSETGSGAFLEADGLVVFEAEHYMQKVDRGAHSWIETMNLAGFSGDGAMVSDPDIGTRIKTDPPNTSPELAYDVNFSTLDTYHIWVRGWAPDLKGAAFYTGLNGAVVANRMSLGATGEWVWTNLNLRGQSMTMVIDAAGTHTVELWMLDDGLAVDKVILTTDATYVPDGVGPPESQQQ